jgi:hypothetical protein
MKTRIIFSIIGIAFCVLPQYYMTFNFDPSGLYYTFSTIAQTLGAITGITGTFLIFGVNVLSNRILEAEDHYIREFNLSLKAEADSKGETRCNQYSTRELEAILDLEKSELPINMYEPFRQYRQRLTQLKMNREIFIKHSLFPFVINIVTMILSIVLIPFSHLPEHSLLFSKFLTISVVYLACWSIIECFVYMYKATKHSI